MNVLTSFVDRLFPLHPPIVGLDISDRSVKIALLKKNRLDFSLEAWGETPVPVGAVESGVVRDAEVFREVLGAAWEASGLAARERWAVVALPEDQMFIRLVTIPAVPPHELRQAVELETEATVPLPADERYADWIILPAETNGEGKHHDIIITAAPKKIVEELLKLFDSLGVVAVALEAESQALARIYARARPAAAESVIIIDLGATVSRLLLVAGGLVRFSTMLTLSGERLNALIAETQGVTLPEAETLKRHVGIANTPEGRRLFAALEPPIKELLNEVGRAARYWEDHVKHRHGVGERISRIFLSGGGARLKGLTEFLSFHAGFPTAFLKVPAFPIALRVTNPATRFDPLTYATALGLALRAARFAP